MHFEILLERGATRRPSFVAQAEMGIETLGQYSDLPPYQYDELVDPTLDTRLLWLYPGQFDEPIRLSIHNVSLGGAEEERPAKQRLSIEQLRETLPSDWLAFETLEEEYIFIQDRRISDRTSWTHPENSVDPSEYVLQQAAFQHSMSRYEALSYTWGDEEDRTIALIGAEDDSSDSNTHRSMFSLPLRRNLATALRHLRLKHEIRTLWVDAVCIDQDNIVERDEQVHRIVDIFEKASRIVMWLGEEDDSSVLAMSKLHGFSEQVVWCPEVRRFFPTPNTTERDTCNIRRYKLPYDAETWSAIEHFFLREWFWRRWIISEMLFANRSSVIQCGKQEVPWNRFRTVATYFATVAQVQGGLQYFRSMLDDVAVSRRGMSTSQLLINFYDRGCQDDRDRIYALLPLAPDAFTRHFRPQYSLSVLEVYRNATLIDIESSNRLGILRLCSRVNRQLNGPSWVPDLTASVTGPNMLSTQFSSGFSAASAIYSEPDKLTIRGFEHSTVKRISSPCPAEMKSLLKLLREWLSVDLAGLVDISKEGFRDKIIRTLCTDYTQVRAPNAEYPSLEQWTRHIMRIDTLDFDSDGTCDSHDEIPYKLLRYILDGFHAMLLKRSFFIAKSGAIGLCPQETQEGKFATSEIVYSQSRQRITYQLQAILSVLSWASTPRSYSVPLRPRQTRFTSLENAFSSSWKTRRDS